jgi:hypothetical protein
MSELPESAKINAMIAILHKDKDVPKTLQGDLEYFIKEGLLVLEEVKGKIYYCLTKKGYETMGGMKTMGEDCKKQKFVFGSEEEEAAARAMKVADSNEYGEDKEEEECELAEKNGFPTDPADKKLLKRRRNG